VGGVINLNGVAAMNKIKMEVHPYEYLLIHKIRKAENGQMVVKIQDKLPLITEVSKMERTDLRKEAELLGLIKRNGTEG
jgi:hypothetical protein